MASIANPGDFLATSEEFVPEQGVREIDEKLYAVLSGSKLADKARRAISVKSRKLARPLKIGDVVYGQVRDIYDQIAQVEIAPPEYDGERAAVGATYCFIRISEVADRFIENFRDVIRIGDVVRARIHEIEKLGTYISMKRPDLGVVQAWCSNCRHELTPRGNMLVCSNCGNQETRKMAETR